MRFGLFIFFILHHLNILYDAVSIILQYSIWGIVYCIQYHTGHYCRISDIINNSDAEDAHWLFEILSLSEKFKNAKLPLIISALRFPHILDHRTV